MLAGQIQSAMGFSSRKPGPALGAKKPHSACKLLKLIVIAMATVQLGFQVKIDWGASQLSALSRAVEYAVLAKVQHGLRNVRSWGQSGLQYWAASCLLVANNGRLSFIRPWFLRTFTAPAHMAHVVARDGPCDYDHPTASRKFSQIRFAGRQWKKKRIVRR